MTSIENANEILPGLWLGNIRAARDETFLHNHKIETVFNCTKDLPFADCVKRRYRVPVDDNLQQDEIRNMELWAFEIVLKLAKERKQGVPILVHCAAGMQRSAAVIAFYLISMYRMKAENAMAFIQSRRPIAFTPQANFGQAIRNFEATFQREVLPRITNSN
jgi:protein-tyrosine phosphatase